MNSINFHKGLLLLGNEETYDCGLYYRAQTKNKLNKEKRKQLKELGWKCKIHTGLHTEIWIFDK